MQKKKTEKERLQRVLTDLEDNYLSVDVLDKFHSSKNLNISFDRVVQKQQEKQAKDASIMARDQEEREALKAAVGFAR